MGWFGFREMSGWRAAGVTAPSVSARRRADPPPPVQSTGGGNLDVEQALAVFLLRAKRGGGGCARSAQTEGESCMLVFELCSTQLCEALDLFEAEDELAEPAPAGFRRAVGMMGGFARRPVRTAPGEAGDLESPEMDQEVELRVGAEETGGEDGAGVAAVFQFSAGFGVSEESQAVADDVAQARFHRRERAVAPEYPEDDPPELCHGAQSTTARSPAGFGGSPLHILRS